MMENKGYSSNSNELKRHFQNYFELLLSNERAKLQQTIKLGDPANSEHWLTEIDLKISYLRGAVRMGKLLCLINSEEAKTKHEILMAERESLLSVRSNRIRQI